MKLIILCIMMCISLSACSVTDKVEDITLTNEFLNAIAEKNWSDTSVKKYMGNPDSYFEDYEIYFDEGIKVKYREIPEINENGWKGYYFSRKGTVENILFDNRYSNSFGKDIDINANKKNFINCMGEPHFIDSELNLFGYKMLDMYIFFIGNDEIEEISVYPVFNYNSDVVDKAVELCNTGVYSRELAEKLYELFENEWDNYNYSYNILGNARYSDRSNSLGIAYYDKGVEVYYSNENNTKPLLMIYGNYKSDISIPPELKKSGIIKYDEKTDFIFEEEKKRLKNQVEFKNRLQTSGKVSPNNNMTLLHNMNSDGLDIVFNNNDYPNYCIRTSPYQYNAQEWINNRYIIFPYNDLITRIYDMQNNLYLDIYISSENIDVLDNNIVNIKNFNDEEYFIEYTFDNSGKLILNSDMDVKSNEHWISGTILDGSHNRK